MAPGKPFDDDDDVTVNDGVALGEADEATTPFVETVAEPEDDAPDDGGAPPEPDTVALRTLAVASLLRRLELESRNAPLKEVEQLEAWVEEHGLHASFGPAAVELFDAPPGEWTEDDVASVGWAAEELAVLAWALNRAELPPMFARADVKPVLATLPRSGDVTAFVGSATVRDLELIDEARALFATLEEAARAETWARGIAEDPSLAEDEESLEAVFEALVDEGFDRAAVTSARGPQGAAVDALKQWSQVLLTQLFSSGSPHAADAFDAKKLSRLDDDALGTFLATSQLRAETLAWLLEGDAWANEEDAAAE